jgi:uncharacterized protein (TIRG00374 family)
MVTKQHLEKLGNSKILWYGASTLILAGLVYAADFNQFVKAIIQIDLFYMSLAMIFGMSVFLVWGYVWHTFFKKLGVNSSLKKSYKLFMAGNFMNSVTPLGQVGGEPFMAYIVSKNTGSTYEKSLSSVISSDLLNTIPNLTYTVVVVTYMFFFGQVRSFYGETIAVLLALSIIILGVGLLLWRGNVYIETKIENLVDIIVSKSSIADKIYEASYEKLVTVRQTFREAGKDKSHLLKTTAISHLALPTQFITLYLILLGLNVQPVFSEVIIIVLLGGLAIFSPTPGGTGAFEAAFSGLLILFYPNIGLEVAAAAAVLFRLTTYWPGIPIGYAALISLRGEQS